MTLSANPLDWEEADLLALLANKIEEDSTLEYKGPDALQSDPNHKKEISKDVSALANSGGGTIVYGITENKHYPIDLKGVDPKVITKEWLEQVIAGNIQPRPEVTIKPVLLQSKHPGMVAYVLKIAQGTTAHQSLPHYQYFKRYNFQAVPMPDFEIRDVMNRLKHPVLEPLLTVHRIPASPHADRYRLNIAVVNRGQLIVHNWKFILQFPNRLILSATQILPLPRMSYRDNVVIEGEPCREITVASAEVVFPDDRFDVGNYFEYEIAYALLATAAIGRLRLRWRLYADNMPAKSGDIHVSKLGESAPT